MASAEWLEGVLEAVRPPASLSLSEWADREFYLSAESAAEPGPWTTLPYQRGVMDAITDPAVERITWMKSARVGATKLMNATIGYYMDQDPCPIMMVQPTVEDAEGYSREEIAPMLRDCRVLSYLIGDPGAKKTGQTLLHKWYPGGSLTMVGANSPRGFRRVSRRVVIFDEVDGYPPSAGAEGDQIRLGIKRTEYYWNRKIIAASTPTIAGISRIEPMFEDGDRRRYFVPCPECGHRDILVFRESDDGRGHFMRWDKGDPDSAYFVCSKNGCIILESQKFDMLERGEWVAEGEFSGHASFHIWAAYSYSPNSRWCDIAREFLDAKDRGVEALKTFVNTVLGECWKDRGDAPAWERLFRRRESYPIGSVPAGVEFLTAGVDVQKDRLVFEVVGWSLNRESWSIESGVLLGDTSGGEVWALLDELIGRSFPTESGGEIPIAMTAVDSGYNTQQVYSWARRYPMSKVIAVKGSATARTLVGTPSAVDVTMSGRRVRRSYKVWSVGTGIAKSELYGWLRLELDSSGGAPAGFCHFPEYGEEFFRQITAEQLITVKRRNGFTALEWQLIPNRENHFLDCRVYARAAASVLGLDRASPRPAGKSRPATDSGASSRPSEFQNPAKSSDGKRSGSWFQKGAKRGRRGRGGFGRRR